MKRSFRFMARMTCLGLVIACSAEIGLSAGKANYSGKYSAERKAASSRETDSTLKWFKMMST